MAWENPITTWGQAGQTVPGVDDFNRIEGNIDILGKYDRAPGYGTATGTNAKTITLDPAPESYYEGLCFAFKNATQNTGAVTINVNNMGAKGIKKPNGNNLVSGNLKAGSVYTVRYNGTNFILQGSDSSGDAMPGHVLAGKIFSNDSDTDITGTMPDRGATNYTPGTTDKNIADGYHNGSGKVYSLGGNAPQSAVRADYTFSSNTAGRAKAGTMPVNSSQTATLNITGASKPTKTVPAGFSPGGTITAQVDSSKAGIIKLGETLGGCEGTLFVPGVEEFSINADSWVLVSDSVTTSDTESIKSIYTIPAGTIAWSAYDRNLGNVMIMSTSSEEPFSKMRLNSTGAVNFRLKDSSGKIFYLHSKSYSYVGSYGYDYILDIMVVQLSNYAVAMVTYTDDDWEIHSDRVISPSGFRLEGATLEGRIKTNSSTLASYSFHCYVYNFY